MYGQLWAHAHISAPERYTQVRFGCLFYLQVLEQEILAFYTYMLDAIVIAIHNAEMCASSTPLETSTLSAEYGSCIATCDVFVLSACSLLVPSPKASTD